MDKHILLKEFAKIVGVSQPRMSKICAEGHLDGAIRREKRSIWVNVKKGKALLRKSLDRAQSSKILSTIGTDAATQPSEPDPALPGTKSGTSYSNARTMNEGYKAFIRKMEYEEKLGKLVPADKVRETAFKVGRIIRDAMLGITDRVSSQLAVEQDENIIRELLDLEITAALESLQSYHG